MLCLLLKLKKVLNELRDVVKVCRWWFDHGSVEYINNLQQTKDNLESVNRFIDECKDPDERVKLYQRRNAIAESYGMLLQNYEKIASVQKQLEKELPGIEKKHGMDADLIEKTKKALRYIEDENKNTRAKLDKAIEMQKKIRELG